MVIITKVIVKKEKKSGKKERRKNSLSNNIIKLDSIYGFKGTHYFQIFKSMENLRSM